MSEYINLRYYLFLSFLFHLLIFALAFVQIKNNRIGEESSPQTEFQFTFNEQVSDLKKTPMPVSKNRTKQRSKRKAYGVKAVSTPDLSKNSGSSALKSSPYSEILFNKYMHKVRQAIERKKEYPLIALRKKQEGLVEVEFSISKSGEVLNIIKIKSEHRLLQDSVESLLSKNIELPPIPKELQAQSIRLKLAIRFKLDE